MQTYVLKLQNFVTLENFCVTSLTARFLQSEYFNKYKQIKIGGICSYENNLVVIFGTLLNISLLEKKFKELLVNYWDVIANKGSYKSLINSIKWFEYGDILKLRDEENFGNIRVLQTQLQKDYSAFEKWAKLVQ